MVNNKRVDIPSYQVKKDDVISIRENSKKLTLFKDLKVFLKKVKTPDWLTLDNQKIEGIVKADPNFEDLKSIGEINMIIEYYSR